MKNDYLKLWLIRFVIFVIPFIYGIYLFFHIETIGKILLILPLLWNLIVVVICVCAIINELMYRYEVKKYWKNKEKETKKND